MKFLRFETQWTSPEIRDYVWRLQAMLGRELAVDPRGHRPETYAEAERRAWRRTEVMRRQIVILTSAHCTPVMICEAAK